MSCQQIPHQFEHAPIGSPLGFRCNKCGLTYIATVHRQKEISNG